MSFATPIFDHKQRSTVVLCLIFLIYATWGTGLATDDFVHLNNGLTTQLSDMWLPKAYLSIPVLQYTHALAYKLIGDHLWAYDLLKGLYLGFTFLCTLQFFTVFYSINRAILGAIVFICCPLQDGATLWLTGQYLCLSLGLFLLSYVQAHKGKFVWALVFATLASFSSYGSTPLALGLGLILVLQRRGVAALCLVVPNMVYSLYYMYTSFILTVGTERVPSTFNLFRYLKSYFMQVASFFDAVVGPSAILKMALSISNISLISAIIAIAVLALIWRALRRDGGVQTTNSAPIFGVTTIVLFALGIFALTGLYPQVAFSLGDRVMIFGSFFLATLVIHYLPTRVVFLFAACFLVSFTGLSDHWRSWDRRVQNSVAHIQTQAPALKNLTAEDTLFVSGLQYSDLGPMSHIDHFASNYVVYEVFRYAWLERPSFRLQTFSSRLRIDSTNSVLSDIKFDQHLTIGQSILLYDAEKNILRRIDRDQIAAELSALPTDRRHWTQLLGPGVLRDTIVWLMPSLKYAYP
jgi:hypothetical protein